MKEKPISARNYGKNLLTKSSVIYLYVLSKVQDKFPSFSLSTQKPVNLPPHAYQAALFRWLPLLKQYAK
jgi:hypothetical protein